MSDPKSDDYYKVLGVAREATEQEISKAYKKAAIRWHPDKNQGDPAAEEAFKRVAEAYDTLSKKDKRATYDRFGKEGLKGAGAGGGGGNFDHAQAEEIFTVRARARARLPRAAARAEAAAAASRARGAPRRPSSAARTPSRCS
jgi:DnaJ-class molecular chaperone